MCLLSTPLSGAVVLAGLLCALTLLPSVHYNERWRFTINENVSLRMLARQQIVDAVFTEKGREAAAVVLQSMTHCKTEHEAEDRSRIADLLNPDSQIPLIPFASGSLLGGQWRTVFSMSGHELNISLLSRRERLFTLCGGRPSGAMANLSVS